MRFELNGQIVGILKQKDDQMRRGITNIAQAVGSAVTYIRLATNVSSLFGWLQIGITTTFTVLASANVVSYKICNKKLKELRDALMLVRDMEGLVAETELVIRQAEKLYMNEQ